VGGRGTYPLSHRFTVCAQVVVQKCKATHDTHVLVVITHSVGVSGQAETPRFTIPSRPFSGSGMTRQWAVPKKQKRWRWQPPAFHRTSLPTRIGIARKKWREGQSGGNVWVVRRHRPDQEQSAWMRGKHGQCASRSCVGSAPDGCTDRLQLWRGHEGGGTNQIQRRAFAARDLREVGQHEALHALQHLPAAGRGSGPVERQRRRTHLRNRARIPST
jgi:hypothetical protein